MVSDSNVYLYRWKKWYNSWSIFSYLEFYRQEFTILLWKYIYSKFKCWHSSKKLHFSQDRKFTTTQAYIFIVTAKSWTRQWRKLFKMLSELTKLNQVSLYYINEIRITGPLYSNGNISQWEASTLFYSSTFQRGNLNTCNINVHNQNASLFLRNICVRLQVRKVFNKLKKNKLFTYTEKDVFVEQTYVYVTLALLYNY
jgi:hypothetical protein